MALKATIYKVALSIADLDRGYYGDHALTLARHPSETDARLMVRLLAFVLYADARLEFGRGLSSTDEPALWQRDYGGEIEHWIEVGLPDARLLKRALGRADRVSVLAYGGREAEIWYEREIAALGEHERLHILYLDSEQSGRLTALAGRNMQLQCTVQEGQVWIVGNDATHLIELRRMGQ
jgi:uncharacterized protein YaeQ